MEFIREGLAKAHLTAPWKSREALLCKEKYSGYPYIEFHFPWALGIKDKVKKLCRDNGGFFYNDKTFTWQMPKFPAPQITNSQADAVKAFCVANRFQISADLQALFDQYAREKKWREYSYKVDDGIPIVLSPEWKIEPKPYQVVGARYMARAKRAILGDHMGTGKTLQSVLAANMLGCQRVLVITRPTLRRQWEQEIHKYLANQNVYCQGSGEPLVTDCQWLIVSNAMLMKQQIELANDFQPQCVITDEGHDFKNSKAQRSKAWTAINKGDAVEYAFYLTGTPLKNGKIEDLVNVLSTYGYMKRWGGVKEFRKRFSVSKTITVTKKNGMKETVSIESNKKTKAQSDLAVKRAKEVNAELRGICYIARRFSDVVPQLPETTRQFLPFELPNMRAYRDREDRCLEFAAEMATRREAFQKTLEGLTEEERKEATEAERRTRFEMAERAEGLIRISQCAQEVGRQSIDIITELTKEFLNDNEDESLFVVTNFQEVTEGVSEAVTKSGYECPAFYGKTSEKEKNRIKDAFNNKEYRAIVASIRAGGTGLNLPVARNGIMGEPNYSASDCDQAEGRIKRMNSTGPFHWIYLSARGTIAEDMWAVCEMKRAISEAAQFGNVTSVSSSDSEDWKQVLDNMMKRRRGETIIE